MRATDTSKYRQPRAGAIDVGSEAHKERFCRMLLDTHNPYEAAAIAWPVLAEEERNRLRALPFWDVAVETEGHAAARIEGMAAREKDPLIKEALDLMAFEERRHKRVIETMSEAYGITLADEPPYVSPPDAQLYFMRTGYGECLDSFFAFGLFEMARRSGFFPPELVEAFEPIIQEEARHIVFFVNWAAHAQAKRPVLVRPAFLFRRMRAVVGSATARLRLMGANGGGSNFTVEGWSYVNGEMNARTFLDLCLAENERRLGRIDERLLRPRIMPTLVRLVRPFVGRA